MVSKARPLAADPLLISAQKGLSEQLKEFRQANDARSSSQTLLRPDDILSGEADAGKLWRYVTSRHGDIRPMTMDDLLHFKRLTDQLKSRYKKGIKPKDVIDLSLAADRDRAAKEIRTSVPTTTRGGEIRFMTSAGPNSDKQRHYVTVRLLNFEAAVVSARQPTQIVNEVIKGPCAISCDCGRWRYWYAYLATAGGYNGDSRHRESAFPKIRNPNLHGVACKHIIRTMVAITQSGSVRAFIAKMISAERNKVSTNLQRNTLKDMSALQAQMRKESSRSRQVKTTGEKKAQRLAQPSYQRQLAARKKMREATAKKPVAQKRVPDAKFIQMLMQGGFSQAAAQAALAAAKAAQ